MIFLMIDSIIIVNIINIINIDDMKCMGYREIKKK